MLRLLRSKHGAQDQAWRCLTAAKTELGGGRGVSSTAGVAVAGLEGPPIGSNADAKPRVPKERRPPGPYALFLKDPSVWKAAKEKSPGGTFQDVSRVMAEQWKALSSAEKQRYKDTAAQSHKAWSDARPKSTRSKRVSGYNLFVADNFDKLREPHKPTAETMKAISAEWNSSSGSVKQDYQDRARAQNASPSLAAI